ncbi:phage holin family protein [Fictibacillus iocasae]|uniref:Phage holin family protein n=1 Tax=Fictibacillus iocasae TaxID=2715437 RepID=A0ABW2NPC1_9BACL
MRVIASWLINTALLMAIAGFFEAFYIKSTISALVASILLSVFHAVLKPILILLTLPVTVLSLGLFLIVINASLLMLTSWVMGPSFVIDGFGMALGAALLLSLANIVVQRVIFDQNKNETK